MSNKTFSKEVNELWDWISQTNLKKINYTLIDLRSMAKAQNIKGYYKMNKVTLFEKLLDGLDDKYDRIKFSLCIDNNLFQKSFENENKDDRNIVQTNLEDNLKSEKKIKKYFCVHGRYQYSYRACRGSLIWPHGRQKYYCLDCPGSGICPHKRPLYLCRDCEGAGICRHGKQRPFCRPCGGTMFCQHDKRKDYCKICSNISKIMKTEPVNI